MAAMYYAAGLLFATMGASAGSEGLLTRVYNKYARQPGDPEANVLLMGWDNIPVRSEKSLYDIAMWIHEDENLSGYILDTPSHDLVGNLEQPEAVSVSLFPEFASRFNAHLKRFGYLVFQIDFAEPLPLDHPEMLLETIRMYLRGQGTNPYERQQASEKKRIQTTETMRNRLKGFKRWAFVKALNWGQPLAEVREDALADIGLGYPILRAMLRELGNRFVQAGAIQQTDDIFWLEKNEVVLSVSNLGNGIELENLSARVEQRKAFNKKAGKETPPPMMPMKKKYMGIDTRVWLAESESNRTGSVLKGVPTSAGKVTAPARLLRGPEDFEHMRPGEVLVAGTTTPAWTPLFAMASAVVTDIGGPLSHGSIVAREYGIPAVMGTGLATKRIQSGQVITVDGTKGEVILETDKQSQPEPSAPPATWKLPKGNYAAVRNNIVELMADPLSPLFATLGVSAINTSLHRFMNEAFDMRGIMPPEIILVVNHYAYNNGSVSAGSLARITFGAGRIWKKMFTGAVERWTEDGRPHYYQPVNEWQTKDWRSFSSVELVNSARLLTESAIDAYASLVSGVIPAAWTTEARFTKIYSWFIKRKNDPSAPVYLLGYDSLPIRADKSLYSLAEWVKQYPELAQCLERTSTSQLIAICESRLVPGDIPTAIWDEWRMRFDQHLQQYGHMIYDLDFVHPVPADDPTAVIDALKLYLSGQGVNPYMRQRESAERRERAEAMTRLRLRGLRLKWFNKYLASAQKYAPLREDGLAEIGLAYPLIRQMLLEVGNRFAQHEVIASAEDIFWLTEEEVLHTATKLDAGEPVELLAVHVPQRKREHQAALNLKPPLALPQMKIFGFDLMSLKDKRGRRNKGDLIKGVAASPGCVTGTACVMHGPEEFSRMRPGDVLVAPITTPAWTPLFSMAAAIVTDVGGPLSHGSIVAREYGIPAVLGTGVATHLIHSGDILQVNGGEGQIRIKARASQAGGTALEWPLPHPKAVLARGSFAEFVPEPVSPLFATLAVPLARDASNRLMNRIGVVEKDSYVFAVINSYLYIGMVFTPKMTWQMSKASIGMLKSVIKTSRQRAIKEREKFLAVIEKWQVRELSELTPLELLSGVREIFRGTAEYYNMAQSATIPTSLGSEAIFGMVYKTLVKRKSDPDTPIFLFGSENHAIRAEKALFDLAMWAKGQPGLADYLTDTPPDVICTALRTDLQPVPVLREFVPRFNAYLCEFGHAIYDLDFAKPVPADDPTQLLETIKVYLSGKNNPYERQRAMLERREQATENIIRRLDPLRRRWFLKSLKWAQDTAPMRENSIAEMGLGHPQMRRMLGELGRRFTESGAISCPEDIYWLVAQEADVLAIRIKNGESVNSFASQIELRKTNWQTMRKITPPNTLPQKTWMSKFYADNDQSGSSLKGLGASAGKVTARACVMLGPEDFNKMQPGDVIVAGITTPAWTPLCVRASAIVTDIGGPLSHSSIVAREYGIPAVLATGNGTRRIRDGQLITVDGGLGVVSLN
jgi:phosphohistidine swiveling domain-containing protein